MTNNRRTLLRFAAAAAAGASLGPLWRRARAQTGAAPLDTVPLRDGLSQVTGAGGNMVLLATEQGAALVDSGAPEASDMLRALLDSRLGGRGVDALLNTHWHLDHTGGNEPFGAAGTPILAHENTRLWMSTEHFVDWQDRTYPPRPKSALPTRTFYASDPQPLVLKAAGEEIEYGHLLDFDGGERHAWTYWPTDRAGLKFDLMHAKHRALTHELVYTVASEKGYHKLLNIMQLEYVLAATSGTGFPRGIEDYTLALFGVPSTDSPWGWRLEGHHISLNVTVAPGEGVTVTPTFLGADPAEVTFGPLAGARVLRAEEDLGRRLVTSLTAEQRAAAILPGDPAFNAKAGFAYPYDAPWDLYASNILKERAEWDAWRTELGQDGVRFGDLDGAQQAMLLALLDEVFTTYRPEIAGAYRSSLDLDALTFAWIGGLAKGEPHYYRIQTGDFLFEYDNVQGNANHVHEVWRSRAGDFGEDLLRRHRARAH